MSHENRPSNIKALTSPAMYKALAALVVVEAEVELLVLLGDALEVPVDVPVVVLLAFPLLEFSVPRRPPKTFAGTFVSFTLPAALLNESRVSDPLELQGNQELVDTYYT